MADQKLKFLAVLDDKVSGGLLKIRQSADKLGGKGTGASFFGNLSATAVAKGFGLIDRAIAGTIDILGDAVGAALAEEKSIAGLDAALKANVKGWDGNNEAMEKVLASRMRLGHSDDEQRESLKLLVAATGDVNKALDVQRVAMDLAALKGISLQAASEALVKVEAGQFRILKSLGIQLPKNATATEALAAVQKVAAGSAEALANTSGGKMLAAQIKVGEAMEKLGEKILPLVVTGTNWLADAVGDAVKDLEDLARGVELAGDAAHDLFEDVTSTSHATAESLTDDNLRWRAAFGDAGAAVELAARRVPAATKFMADHVKDDLAIIVTGANTMKTNVVAVAAALPGEIAAALRKKRATWQDAVDLLHDDITNSMTNAAEQSLIQAKLSGDNIVKGLKSKDPVVRAQAKATKKILEDRLLELREDARDYGTSTITSYAKGILAGKVAARTAAQQIAFAVRDILQTHSPAKEGPLSEDGGPEGWGERTGMLYGKGLAKGLPNLGAALGASLGGASLGRGSGGGAIHVSFPSLLPPGPAQMQAAAAVLVPAIERERRRIGLAS